MDRVLGVRSIGAVLAAAAFATAADAQTWSLDQLSQDRRYQAAASVGNRVLFAGGYVTSVSGSLVSQDTVDVLDVETGTWTTARLSEPRHSLAAVALPGEAVFAGGAQIGIPGGGKSAVVDFFDAETGQRRTATLSVARAQLAATVVGEIALFAGGLDSGGGFGGEVVDLYDARTDTWSTAQLSEPRFELAATSVGRRAFFAGGSWGSTRSERVDVFDAASGTWSLESLSVGRSYFGAATIGQKAYFAGGWMGSAQGESDVVDVFDATTNSWSWFPMPFARSSHAVIAVGHELLVAGGTSTPDTVSIYDTLTGVWRTRTLSVSHDRIVGVARGNEGWFVGDTTFVSHYTAGFGGPALTLEGLVAGQQGAVTVRSCSPAGVVILGVSTVGGGPMPTSYGDVFLTPPIVRPQPGIADSAGVARWQSPLGLPWRGHELWAQAFDVGQQALSNGASSYVR